MTTVSAWVLHCLLIAGVLTVAAVAWERSARWSGGPARWGWFVALGGSVTLPWLLRLVPVGRWPEVLPAAIPVLVLEPVEAAQAQGANGWSAVDIAMRAWLLASVAALLLVAVLLVRLERARRGWRTVELEGGPVCVARDVGPAAVGIGRIDVVIPAWALELEEGLRALLLQHEREHVLAGDPRMLLAGLLSVAAMPWNVLLWLQFMRLRNAIELDCDARVLRTGVNPRRYATLLLEVGQRRSANGLVMATFAEPRMFLQQRIRRIAQWPLRRQPLRALSLGFAAILLFATALSARDPLRGGGVVGIAPDIAPELPGALVSDTPPTRPGLEARPKFTPFTVRPQLLDLPEVQRALMRNYPPLLRDAGIGGSPTVWLFIDEEGTVTRTQLSRSSGHEALDSAALRVARTLRFSPARNRDAVVPVWVEVPIVFTPPGADPPRQIRTGDPPAGAPPPPPAAPPPPPLRGGAQSSSLR